MSCILMLGSVKSLHVTLAVSAGDPSLILFCLSPNQITVFLYFLGNDSMTGMVIHSQGAKVLSFWLIYRVKSCRYLHVRYLCISYLGHTSKLFYSCFQRYAPAPPTYSQTSSKSHFYIWNEDVYSYMIPWLWNCLNHQCLPSQSAFLIPSRQGRQKDLKPALLQILSALRGLLTGTRRSWSVLIELRVM